MGYQVIKQPDGRYAIFSSYTDTWCESNADRDEVFDWFAERAKEESDRQMMRVMEAVDTDPRQAYYQFAMSFEEANAKSIAHGGGDLASKPGAPSGVA